MATMIDTWLLASASLAVLAAAVLLRIARARTRHDRYVAAMVAVMIGSASGLTLGLALGTLIVIDATIVVALVCFAGIIAFARNYGGAGT